MTRWRLVAAALVALGAGQGAAAQGSSESTTVDPRAEAALKQAGLAYGIDGGDFRLKYETDSGRSQLVWVASGTATLAALEIRDVWSVAHRAQGTVPADLAARLLQENARLILGAWQANQGRDEYLVVFSAQVDAAVDAATLEEVIEVVMLSADRMEQELTGKDDF